MKPRRTSIVLQGRPRRRPSWWPKDDSGWVTINAYGGWTAGFDRASTLGVASGRELREFIGQFAATQSKKWEFRMALLVDAAGATRVIDRGRRRRG